LVAIEKTNPRVLIVDDERPIRRFLNTFLGNQYTVLEAATGQDALQASVKARPDALILDLGLPDIDGIEVTRRLREWTQVPIIIISVSDNEKEKIAAFDAGADDFLVKPFSIGELMARLRVALRRNSNPDSEPVYRLGSLSVDLTRRLVSLDGHYVSLTPTEYDVLRALIRSSGKVLTHQQIIHLVWGSSFEADSHLLRVNISNIRRKIESDPLRPHYLLTEPGVGYRLMMEPA
jgi:two-component system, OmpR family, KDP operon response regulator KdpE